MLTEIYTLIQNFKQQYRDGIVVFRWATATWKSRLSVELARERIKNDLKTEIISCDSRQIFRYMDIGTDKVSQDILNEIPHHQIDIIDPDWFYTAGEWKKDVEKLIPEILARDALPVIVWWTGLYIDTLYKNYSVPEVQPDFSLRAQREALEAKEQGILRKKLYEVDPEEAKKHHPNSTRYIIRALEIFEKTGQPKSQIAQEQPVQRPMLMIGLWRETQDANNLIEKRVYELIDRWLIDETIMLLKKGFDPSLQSMQGIWYKETVAYLANNNLLPKEITIRESLLGDKHITTKEQLIQAISLHTQQYAKRQRTRFRRYIHDATNNPKERVVYKVFSL